VSLLVPEQIMVSALRRGGTIYCLHSCRLIRPCVCMCPALRCCLDYSIGTAAIDVNAPLDPSLLEEAHSHRAATVLLELTTTAQSLLETDVNDQAASSMSGTNSASSSSTTEVEALLRMADVADDVSVHMCYLMLAIIIIIITY